MPLAIPANRNLDLSLGIEDNGVGIDPEVIDAGRAGHFGIQGMKERSARIRAKITISSNRNSGTQINLTVPGDVVYRRETSGLIARVWPFASRKHSARVDNQKKREKRLKDES
jgi:hypothetical protein